MLKEVKENTTMHPQKHHYDMIGQSPPMRHVFESIERIKNSDATVYIYGESGTGKELVAKALHQYGRRGEQPFVAVNVSAFTENLLESELFGIERRVATGVDEREGLFHSADKGTLFLDEIADMSKPMQAKLLRALQERAVIPVGGNPARPKQFDVRFIAASHYSLDRYVREGQVRQDLRYRLQECTIHLPPLRERGEDIKLLAEHFLEKYSRKEQKKITFHPAIYDWLYQQPWRGNVRELEFTISGLVAETGEGEALTPSDFLRHRGQMEGLDGIIPDSGFYPDSTYRGIRDLFKAAEQKMLHKVMKERIKLYRGNLSAVARSFAVDRSNLRRIMIRMGMPYSKELKWE